MKQQDKEILKRVWFIMNYNPLSTINEQVKSALNASQIGTRETFLNPNVVTSDVLSKEKHQTQQIKQEKELGKEKILTLKDEIYKNTKVEPKPPLTSTIQQTGKVFNGNEQLWNLPYDSIRAKNRHCSTKGCYCQNVGGSILGPFCKGLDGQNKLKYVYQQDKKDWDLLRSKNQWDFVNTHEFYSYVSITSTILGFIPTPLSAVFFAVGTISDIMDAFKYKSEGDEYMFYIMLALAIIPGGEFAKITGISAKKLKDFLKLYHSSEKTPLLRQQYKKVVELFFKFLKPINQKIIFYMLFNLNIFLKTKPVKYLANFLVNICKIYNIKLVNIIFKVGGTVYTADKIYLYVFSDVFKNNEKLKSRISNEYRYLINKWINEKTGLYKTSIEEYEKFFEEQINEQLEKSMTEPGLFKVLPQIINQTNENPNWEILTGSNK